jgi:hypothetical protein
MLRKGLPAACLLASLVLAGGVAGTARVTTGGTFADPAGDAVGGAPDITGLTATVDETRGVVTFRLAVVVSETVATMVSLYLDEDRNASTGDPELGGADVVVDDFHEEHSYGFSRWDAAAQKWVRADGGPDLGVSVDSTGVTFTIDRSDLGGSTRAYVFASAALVDDKDAWVQQDGRYAADWAPDQDAFDVPLHQISLSTAAFKTSRAKAGSSFSLALAAARDGGGYVDPTDGGEFCSATIAGKKIAVAAQGFLTSKGIPVAVCSWRLGRATAGKAFRASVTITSGGATLTHTVSTKIQG